MNTFRIINIDLSPIAPINDMGILKTHLLSGLDDSQVIFVNLSCNPKYGLTTARKEYRYYNYNTKSRIINPSEIISITSKTKKPSALKNFLRVKLKPIIHVLKLLFLLNDNRLINFISDEKPNILFTVPVSFLELMLIYRVHKKTDIPVNILLTDDILKHTFSNSYFRLIFNKIQYIALKKVLLVSKNRLTISYSLSDYYSKIFNVNFTTILDGVDVKLYHRERIKIYRQTSLPDISLTMRYIGHAEPKRINNILLVAKAVDQLNYEGYNITFEIFFNEDPKNFTYIFEKYNGVLLKDPVPYSQVISLQCQSDILLHTESFERKIIDRFLKHTVSTKIAQYNSSGAQILAFGPKEIESMRLLTLANSAHFVYSYSINQLKNVILQTIHNKKKNKNGILFSLKYQNLNLLSAQFIDILKK